MSYIPLDSVWEGNDAELLEAMLQFYPRKPPERILDATYGTGRFWKGTSREVTSLDIDSRREPDYVADNRDMPFEDESFDVVVYDPPHLGSQGRSRSKKYQNFGLNFEALKAQGYSLSYLYPPFMAEAYRVLIPEGILLCKVADIIQNHRYQWAHIDLKVAGEAAGFTACDMIIKVRKGPMVSSKWKKAHHARKRHCHWLIFRKSRKCE